MSTAKGGWVAGVAALALALAGCSTQSNGTSSVSADGNLLTIYVSAPLGYQSVAQEADIVDAEQLAFAQDAGQERNYKLRMQIISKGELSSHGRDAIDNKSAIAYIGELAPGASEQTAGITNAQDLLQVAPTDTALELTLKTPTLPKAPRYFYESPGSYGRTFARIVPSSSVEAKATVAEMKQLGISPLYISDDDSTYGAAVAEAVRQDASTAGIAITQTPAKADGVFFGASDAATAARAFMAAAQAAPSATLFGPSALDTAAFASALTTPPANLYISTPGVLPSAEPAAYTQFASAFKTKYGHEPSSQAAFGYEAMAATIAMIVKAGHLGDNRGTVVKDFLHITNRTSAVGTYSMNTNGDSNLKSFVFNKLQGGALVPTAVAQG